MTLASPITWANTVNTQFLMTNIFISFLPPLCVVVSEKCSSNKVSVKTNQTISHVHRKRPLNSKVITISSKLTINLRNCVRHLPKWRSPKRASPNRWTAKQTKKMIRAMKLGPANKNLKRKRYPCATTRQSRSSTASHVRQHLIEQRANRATIGDWSAKSIAKHLVCHRPDAEGAYYRYFNSNLPFFCQSNWYNFRWHSFLFNNLQLLQ